MNKFSSKKIYTIIHDLIMKKLVINQLKTLKIGRLVFLDQKHNLVY